MKISDILRSNLDRSVEVYRRLTDACLTSLVTAAEALVAAYRAGHKAIFFGNGGSASDAEHLAAEFLGRYLRERKPLPALALSANSSVLTAIGNDCGYQEVFARQLECLAAAGEVAAGLGTSGNSPGVIYAINRARRLGIFSIALTGVSGGQLGGLADVWVAVPSEETPRIQELSHSAWGTLFATPSSRRWQRMRSIQ